MPDACLSGIEVGWLAGIIDGEGSVFLSKTKGYRKPILSVSSTDVEILEHIQSLLGGSIIKKNDRSEKWKAAWEWRVQGAIKVIDALRKVAPCLKCPKKSARTKILLEQYQEVTQRNGKYTEQQKIAKKDFEKRFMNL